MTPLRRRMIEDMRLAGLCEGTQQTYQYAIALLAKSYNQSPELLTEEQVAAYLRDMLERRKVARLHGERVAHGALARGESMKAIRVKSRRTGRAGWRIRYTSPLTHTRSWRTFWYRELRDAEQAFRLFLEGLEDRALGVADKSGWTMRYEDAVTKFLAEAPISTDRRRRDLERVLRKNYLGLQVLADLCRPGTLTASCRRLVVERGDAFTRGCVQRATKQLSTWAASIGLLPYDPLGSWKLLPRTSEPKRRRAFLPDEARAILAAADELDGITGRACPASMIFKVLLLSGNRPGAAT